MASAALIKAVAATAELCNKVFSPAAAKLFADDLDGYDELAVMRALTRCRKELKGPFTLEAVVSRIDDGRPGVEEAWAMLPTEEQTSLCWTDEMQQAWGAALPLLQDGDRIAARMAFKEAYIKLVAQARDQKLPAKWTMSFGADKSGHQVALTEAVRHQRISVNAAVALLPPDQAEALLLSLGVTNHPLLAAPNKKGQQKVKELLLSLRGNAL